MAPTPFPIPESQPLLLEHPPLSPEATPSTFVSRDREKRSIDIGHNVTATSWVLRKGQCTVGFQIVGCGLNDRTTLGTSTFLLNYYDMASVAFRHVLKDSAETRTAVQLDYFKTYGVRKLREGNAILTNGGYDMEAVWLMWIKTWRFRPDYHFHVNIHTNYYFNERMPFSLRRPYLDKTPFQLNIMTMHEVDLVSNWVMKGELGIIDALRNPAHLHSGATIGQNFNRLHWHFGFSMTSTLLALFSPSHRYDYQQHLRAWDIDGYNSNFKDKDDINYDFSIHPELSIQYYF